MVIFHSYVSLPKGKLPSKCRWCLINAARRCLKASGWALLIQNCSETNQECHGNLVFLQSNHVAFFATPTDPQGKIRQSYYSSQEPNKDFAQKLVQTFNWILLTAAETRQLREELLEESQSHPQLLQLASLPNSTSGTGAKEVKPLFLELLEPWFHNPASALALCLLACTWLKPF